MNNYDIIMKCSEPYVKAMELIGDKHASTVRNLICIAYKLGQEESLNKQKEAA